jgi:branched-chain amino acid transport system ATP-binding protein
VRSFAAHRRSGIVANSALVTLPILQRTTIVLRCARDRANFRFRRVRPDAQLDDDVILKLDNLSRSFGSLKAVDGVGLEVASGEALGIIGPNGAGKSTLFNLITGLLKPDDGAVYFDGDDITHAPPRARCIGGIGRSFQIPHPFENLTVFENLLVAAIHGRRQREADLVEPCGDILQRTGLLGFANRRAGTLNLLGRKRLELARALASGPRLLLLDEIAGGLTEAECVELVALIQDIKKSGVTIVWIEHIVHALVAVVSRLVVLNFGRKIMEGEPRMVMASAEVREIYMGIAA